MSATPQDTIGATERWFIKAGLPYFVPSERAAARAALAPRRTAPVVLLVGVAAVAIAISLSYFSRDLTFAPATLTLIGILAAGFYAITALRARPILSWAVRRTWHSLRAILPMVTRAVPLLLMFVTFLFINAEVWMLASHLDGGVLWLAVLLFAVIGVMFLLARLPEEVDRVDDRITLDLVESSSRHTPLEGVASELVRQRGDTWDLKEKAEVQGYERANLILVLAIVQASQVLLLSIAVFLFFLVFGGLTVPREVQEAWIAIDKTHAAPFLGSVSAELVQVSVFLAAFSGLYFTVYVLTDDTYRDQFFTGVLTELERAVALRMVYGELRAQHERQPDPPTVPLHPGEPG